MGISTENVTFTKAHGAGNDFILLDGRKLSSFDFQKTAKEFCNRHLSIGADGLIILLDSKIADFKMAYFNSDGSRSVCANGLRCLAHFTLRLGESPDLNNTKNSVLSIETDDGVKLVKKLTSKEVKEKGLSSLNPEECYLQAEMGRARFLADEIPFNGEGEQFLVDLNVGDQKFKVSLANMGNPHCVIFVDDVETTKVPLLGPLIENHPLFPERTNVEFVEIVSSSELKIRIWERGVGETLACGTGNCAVFAVSSRLAYLNGAAKISSPGGQFYLEYGSFSEGATEVNSQDNIILTGPAEIVFNGEICL